MAVAGSDVPNETLRKWWMSSVAPNPLAGSIGEAGHGELHAARLLDGRSYRVDSAFAQAARSADQLEWLCLPPGATSEDLEWIGDIEPLRGLSLNGARLRGADLRPLQKLKKLQWLNLKGAELPSATISRLPHLPRLEVLHVDDAGPFEGHCGTLGQFPELRVLTARGTVITDDSLRELVDANPKLRFLDLSGPGKSLTLDSIPELAKLTNLKVLHLGEKEAPPQMFDGLPELQRRLPECFIFTGD